MISTRDISTPSRRAPATAKGERIYAISDIHGCYDLLRRLLDVIGTHTTGRSRASIRLLILGDLIDRGPASREVLQFLMKVQARTPRLVVLLGNHEEMLLRVLNKEISVQKLWLKTGGMKTLESFGIDPPKAGEHPWLLAERLHRALGPDVIKWLTGLPRSHTSGDYFFCHAGIRPGVRLSWQSRSDLVWIRHDFLNSRKDHGKVIVHGHSPSPQVEVRPNRIGIDTGAWSSGVLSSLCLEGPALEIHTVS